MIKAARLGETAPFAEGLYSEHAYWRDVFDRAGLAAVDAALAQSFSLALRFAYHACGQPERFDPWAMVLAQRLAARLCGEAPPTAEDSAYRQQAESRASLSDEARMKRHETAQQIIETAIETILEGGAELAKFREIANRSGLSVSSVQHFFGIKARLPGGGLRGDLCQGARPRGWRHPGAALHECPSVVSVPGRPEPDPTPSRVCRDAGADTLSLP